MKTIFDFKTFASLSWFMQELSMKISRIKMPAPTLREYKLVKGYSTAGRCQVFGGTKKHNLHLS